MEATMDKKEEELEALAEAGLKKVEAAKQETERQKNLMVIISSHFQRPKEQKHLKTPCDAISVKMRVYLILLAFLEVEQASRHSEALERHRADADNLRKSAEELRALLSAAEGQSAKLSSELAESGAERDAALSEKLELEAKIAAAGDERRTLLERCLEVRHSLFKVKSTLRIMLFVKMW